MTGAHGHEVTVVHETVLGGVDRTPQFPICLAIELVSPDEDCA